LTVAVLAISLIRGVAPRPMEPGAAVPAGRPAQRGEGRPGAHGDVTRAGPEPTDLARVGDRGRGREATTPSEILSRRLRDVAKRVAGHTRDDNLTLLAAGVAFYSVLALFPAMVAVVSMYGLVADPAEVSRQIGDLTSALPE